MKISEDGNYPLDGSYVSNWENSTDVTQSLILVPEIILEVIVTCIVIVLILIAIRIMYKLIFINNDKDIVSTSPPKNIFLVFGFMICISLFGLALLVAELSLLGSRACFFVFVKQGLIYVLFISLAFAFFIKLIFVTCLCAHATQCLRKYFWVTFLVFFYGNVVLLDIFTIAWVVVSMYSSILLAFAYPLHMVVLLAIHVGFVCVTSVICAVVVLQFDQYYQQNRERPLRTFIIFAVISLLLMVFVSAVYYLTILGYTNTIVHRVVLTDNPLQVLLVIPSVLLFFGGWLIRRNFFGK